MLAETIAGAVFNGEKVDPVFLEQTSIKCEALREIEEVNHEDINQFYEKEPENEPSEH